MGNFAFPMYLNSENLRYEGGKLIRYEGYTVWECTLIGTRLYSQIIDFKILTSKNRKKEWWCRSQTYATRYQNIAKKNFQIAALFFSSYKFCISKNILHFLKVLFYYLLVSLIGILWYFYFYLFTCFKAVFQGILFLLLKFRLFSLHFCQNTRFFFTKISSNGRIFMFYIIDFDQCKYFFQNLASLRMS